MRTEKRTPCPTCPWRKSTPKKGFPGGIIDAPALLRMARGEPNTPAMQCHCTPDGPDAQVCVGFALQVGPDSVGLRLAHLLGIYSPDSVATDAPLHSLESLLRVHGGHPDVPCRKER